ncbi:MAG: hypothetical protein HYT62_03605 [Candidatus Yanofskybacteria bacterium]|nr:hypothetical protein [Candidatus Yanofskybacteria bacterium]
MTYLRNSILASLVYYDIFDFPLTFTEIYKYLVNPGRLMLLSAGIGDIDPSNLRSELDKLVNSGLIGEKNGFYFLSGRGGLYGLRMERQKISDKKWKKFLGRARWFTFIPYVRGFLACGSLALSNATKNSDFDVFVVCSLGRLYTCRFFLWLVSSLLGVRRKPSERVAPDKFCFNHYVTEADMFLKYQSLYTAQLYSNLKPVFISPELYEKFYSSNIWINNYLYNFKPQEYFIRRSVKTVSLFIFIAKTGEAILNSFLGNILESILKKYQQGRIRRNPLTFETGGRVVYTDTELEFHPHSFEATVIEKYNRGLEKLGIVPFDKEKDSGLTK